MPDHHYIISAIEHVSVKNSVKNAEYIDVGKDGLVLIEDLEHKLIKNKNKKNIISVMLANNETGSIQPIKEIVYIAKKFNAIVHTDASQAIGKIPVDFQDLGVDAMTISGHKFGSMQGCGSLLINDSIKIKPLIEGGPQEEYLRAGTENILAIFSIDIAIEKLNELIYKMQNIKILRDYLEKNILLMSKNTRIISFNSPRLPNTSCISMPGVDKSIQIAYFDLNNIAVGSGAACSNGLMEKSQVLHAMKISDTINKSSLRVSLGWNTEKDEIDIFLEKWKELYLKQNNKKAQS